MAVFLAHMVPPLLFLLYYTVCLYGPKVIGQSKCLNQDAIVVTRRKFNKIKWSQIILPDAQG